jgi:plastocyanin domain-containing protein
LLSFFFATLSAAFYLRRNDLFSSSGIRKKWKYLAILYSTTMIINLLFIYWILPAAANINQQKVSVTTNNQTTENNESNAQIIRMDQLGSGYKPNSFTVKKGAPVKWIITSKSQSCSASIYSKQLGINRELSPGENVINFTPTETGKISFSCYMGMYSGYFDVIN